MLEGPAVSEERLQIAIVGAGRWGSNLVRAFGSLPRCEIRWICDVEPARLMRFSRPGQPPRLSVSIADVIEDAAVDAVVLATPAEAHAEQALAALDARKHVFIEKPMALSVQDSGLLRNAAARSGRVVMVGHLMRYHPAVRALGELTHSGALGRIRHLAAERLGPCGAGSTTGPWWSLAPHDVSLARYFFQAEVRDLAAVRSTLSDESERVSARLSLGDRGTATITVDSSSAVKTRRFRLVGTRGTAIFDDGPEGPVLTVQEPDAKAPRPVPFRPDEALVCEAAHFIDAIVEGRRVITDEDEGHAVVSILEAGEASMRAGGRPMAVSEAGESASGARSLSGPNPS